MRATNNPSEYTNRRGKSRSGKPDATSRLTQAEQDNDVNTDAVIPFPPPNSGSTSVKYCAVPHSKPSPADILSLNEGAFSTPLNDESEVAITSLLSAVRSDGGQLACLWFRTGKYGVIEDVYGPLVGRELMNIIEARLGQCLRKEDALFRVTSNEFVILLSDPVGNADALCGAKRLQAHCSGIYHIDGLRLHVNASIGIAMYPGDATETHDLLRYSRMALHEIGPGNQKRCQCFSPELLTQLRDRASITATLEQALVQDRLVLHYQPQYLIETGQVAGVEALLRLVGDSGELIGPDQFIELAEETNQILELGRWVIEQACEQLARWRQAGLENFRMAVNVSPRQLMQPGFCEMVDAAVVRSGIPHSDLELEITERQMVENLADVERALRQLTAKGVRVAVDDFGTGCSSLAYLMELSVSTVKVDRTFMAQVPGDDRAERLVSAVIAMARELGLELTVEGVETDLQHRFLLECGCDRGQGYNFGRPQSAEAVERLLF